MEREFVDPVKAARSEEISRHLLTAELGLDFVLVELAFEENHRSIAALKRERRPPIGSVLLRERKTARRVQRQGEELSWAVHRVNREEFGMVEDDAASA